MALEQLFGLCGRRAIIRMGLGWAVMVAAFCLPVPASATDAVSGSAPGAVTVPGPGKGGDPVADRFALLDANGDGRISWEEFHAVNEHISRQGFDLMDSSGDAFLSLEEWRVFYAGHGMDVPLSSSSHTLPARPATPPLVMPPRDPSGPVVPADSAPAPAVPASPSPDTPSTPARPSEKTPSVPLVMPPSGAPEAPRFTGPSAPQPPLITPPVVQTPAPVTPVPAVSGPDKGSL